MPSPRTAAAAAEQPPPAAAKTILNYKYSLCPTAEQEKLLSRTMFFIWRGWTRLVRFTRQAQAAIRAGREASIKLELVKMEASKKLTGMRAGKFNKLIASGVTQAEAMSAIMKGDVERTWKMKGSRLAMEYAIAKAEAGKRGMVDDLWGTAWAQLNTKFENSWKACWKKVRRAPRKGRPTDATWLQVQVQGGRSPLVHPDPQGAFCENWVNLALLFPQRLQRPDLASLTRVRLIQHRPWPATGKVKDMKITRSSIRPGAEWWVVFAVEMPAESAALDFPSTGLSCGIDPGQKTPLTVVGSDIACPGGEGQSYGPPRPFARAQRKLRRLQRKLDRQRRANNPECFDDQGRWIKGTRAGSTSKGMMETLERQAAAQAHAASIRADYYQKLSNDLLTRYDTVYLGNWTDGTPKAKGAARERRKEAFAESGEKRKKGEAARQRTSNRVNRDNALGVFRRIVEEKARRSTSPKQIIIVTERNTTKCCVQCGKPTGPSGVADLRVRRWTCSGCGHAQDRDAAAAWNILQKGLSSTDDERAAGKAVMGDGDAATVARISLGDERQGPNSGSGAGTGVCKAPNPGAGAGKPAPVSAFHAVASGNLLVNSRGSLASDQRILNQAVTHGSRTGGGRRKASNRRTARDKPDKDH